MSKIITILFLMIPAVWAQNVKTVDSVDLERYLGKWYQIAAIPQYFQRECASDTSAEYGIDEKGRVRVFNSCLDQAGQLVSASGQGKVVEGSNNSKLKVTFLKFGTWIYLFGGNYWILDLDPEYKWAVVGDPKLEYGWILSRTTAMEPAQLKVIGEKLTAHGYDTCNFMTEIQTDGIRTKQPLCDYLDMY